MVDRRFPRTAETGDLGKGFSFLVRLDGLAFPHFRPSCLDPLVVVGQLIVETSKTAEALARYFAQKSPAGGGVVRRENNPIRDMIRIR